MSTNINISVGDNKLLAQASLQQNASRQAQLEKEANKRLGTQATDVRTTTLATQGRDANGNSLIGTRSQNPQLERRPAANRQGGRGIFGFIDVNNAYGDPGYGDPITYSEQNRINLSEPIVFRSGKQAKYGVIRVVVGGQGDACAADSNPISYYFAGKESELQSFVLKGGVLWINNEYAGCGIDAAIFNSYLNANFGTTISFADDSPEDPPRVFVAGIPYDVAKANLSYSAMFGKAPNFFYIALTCSILNGTSFYATAYGTVCAFQKIGKGFVVLSGDQNGTGGFPAATESSVNFIEALQNLK